MEKWKAYWASLEEDTVINKKLFLFEMITAVLAGILLGLALSPMRSLTIASNNENNGNGNCASADEEKD